MRKSLFITLFKDEEIKDENLTIKVFDTESIFITYLAEKVLKLVNQNVTSNDVFKYADELVLNYAASEAEDFNTIIDDWYFYLGDVLNTDEPALLTKYNFEYRVPDSLIKWMVDKDSDKFNAILKVLRKKPFIVNAYDIYDYLLKANFLGAIKYLSGKLDVNEYSRVVITDGIPMHSWLVKYIEDCFKTKLIPVVSEEDYLKTYKNIDFKSSKSTSKAYNITVPLDFSPLKEGDVIDDQLLILSLHDGVFQVKDLISNKYGYISEKLEELLPPIYDFCGPFVLKQGFVMNEGTAFQFRIGQGLKIIEGYDFHEVHDFSEGLSRVVLKDKRTTVFLDCSGTEIFRTSTYSCGDFKCGLSVIVDIEEGLYGYIDKTGEIIVAPTLEYAYDFKEGYARIEIEEDVVRLVDTNGQEIDAGYESYGDFNDGIAPVWDYNETMGYINNKFENVIPCMYDCGMEYSDGLVAVRPEEDSESWKCINLNNKIKFSIKADSVGSFKNDLCPFARIFYSSVTKKKIGFMNKDGKIVIPCVHTLDSCTSELPYFIDGVCLIKGDKASYYINKNGEKLFDVPNYTRGDYYRAHPFSEGFARISKWSGTALIDTWGNFVTPYVLGAMTDFKEGKAWMVSKINGKSQYVIIRKDWFIKN